MLLAHFGMGLAAKNNVPRVSLWILFPLALLPDILALPAILFPDRVPDLIPWTHGLFMNGVFALAAFLAAWAVGRKLKTAVVCGLLAFSHWVLDLIAWPMFGRGLPLLLKGSPEVGLGLYGSRIGSAVGEAAGLALVIVMIVILRKQKTENRTGSRT